MKGDVSMAYDVILNIAAEVAKKRAESGVSVNPDDTVCVIRTSTGNIYTGINRFQVHNGMVNAIHAEIDAINNMKLNNESIIESITVINSYTLSPILPCNNCINIIISINPENIKCQIVTPVHNIPVTAVNQFVANNTASGTVPPVNYNMNPASQGNNVFPQPGSFMQDYQTYDHSTANTQVNGNSMYNNSMVSTQFNSNPRTSMTSMQMNPPMTSNQLNSNRMNSSLYMNHSQTSSIYTGDKTKSSKGDQLRSKINNLLNDDDEDDEIEDDYSRKKNKKKFGGFFG